MDEKNVKIKNCTCLWKTKIRFYPQLSIDVTLKVFTASKLVSCRWWYTCCAILIFACRHTICLFAFIWVNMQGWYQCHGYSQIQSCFIRSNSGPCSFTCFTQAQASQISCLTAREVLQLQSFTSRFQANCSFSVTNLFILSFQQS